VLARKKAAEFRDAAANRLKTGHNPVMLAFQTTSNRSRSDRAEHESRGVPRVHRHQKRAAAAVSAKV